MDNLTNKNQKRQEALIRATCLFWIIAKVVTYKSWIADRDLPTVAVFDFLDVWPPGVHLFGYISSMLMLTLIILRPQKVFLAVFIIIEIFCVLLDALRIQPWEYLYLFVIAFYLIFNQRPAVFYKFLLLIVASTYIFSGLHKIGGPFLNTVWDGVFLRKLFGYRREAISFTLHYSGLFLGLGEFFSGLLLLLLRQKKLAVAALIAMHVVIIVVIGILFGNYINSIMPWNVMMIIFLLYIAGHDNSNSVNTKNALTLLPVSAVVVVIIFWYMLPFSNLFGYWAHPLSSGMYSGKVPKVYICWSGRHSDSLDERYFLQKGNSKFCPEGKIVSLGKWTHVLATQAPFPHNWYNRRLYHRLREKFPDDDIAMFYSNYPFRQIKEIE